MEDTDTFKRKDGTTYDPSYVVAESPVLKKKQDKIDRGVKNVRITIRAVILNFTKHPQPASLRERLQQKYKYVVNVSPNVAYRFVPYCEDVVTNELTTNNLVVSDLTRTQQLDAWLEDYFSTQSQTGYALDHDADYYVILPSSDGETATHIMLALMGISNREWFFIWSDINNSTGEYDPNRIISLKSVKQHWKGAAHRVTGISKRKEEEWINYISFLNETYNDQTQLINKVIEFVNNLNSWDRDIFLSLCPELKGIVNRQ